ncbi:hypothetical protein DYBT9275_03113 [Dyadobacter sp. CECT 9275]|uniref:FecR family protein n=1 Tax=Dyadobacter helix TaxID=2822344 RepID=A0A916NCP8_9BACT|nr:FecR family protein [Dyadobacter sp. CECT 9275]CAG5003255.1 hypothetical protein DYBT9275_03113 [Dyadobacter sp. CECT 9275]
MKTYLSYKTEDFVQDPYFRKWALGELSPEDRFWETWRTTHPEQYPMLEKARSIVIALHINDIQTNPDEIKGAIDEILAATELEHTVHFYKKNRLSIAASILLLLALGFLALRERPAQTGKRLIAVQETNQEKQEVNQGSAPKTITLTDGSRVTLEPKSRLRIGKTFGGNTREVYLTGEAFFQVAKNPEKPFLVYTGKVITKVLGTSFRIKAYDTDANVSIGVRTGKVTVFKQTALPDTDPRLSEEVILTPNQQAVFVKKEDRFVKTLVEKPAALNQNHLKERLDFTETSIPEVFSTLEQIYGLKIICDADQLKDCNLTGSLNDGTLYDKLSIVCETIQASYKVMDGQVVIYGKGCK